MKKIDTFIQYWRMKKAVACLPAGKLRVVDIGAHQGEFFGMIGERLQAGFGIEPLASERSERRNYEIVPGFFPDIRPAGNGTWDAVTMLAVLEHVPMTQQPDLAKACHELLRTGGRLIITVPGPRVDSILSVLKFFRLIDGMSLEEHYGFSPADVEPVFTGAGFRLLKNKKFQFGLNNVYVFEK